MTDNQPLFADLFSDSPSDWKVMPFQKAVDFQEGHGLLAKDFHPSGVPLVLLKGIQGASATIEAANFLCQETVAKRWSHFRLQKGDLLPSSSASLGRVSEAGEAIEGAVAYTGIIRMRPATNEVDRGCIKCFTQSSFFSEQIRMSATGSVINRFGPTHLKQMRMLAPCFPEQKAIAHILGTLDDKIERNRMANETLEAMAKALFKSWFVDFDPVRAKAEGRPTGLPAEISDLFPDSFEDSELGEIPRGWRDGEIHDVAEPNPETRGSRNQPLSVGYLDPSKVKHGKIDCIEEYQCEDAPSRASRILKTGDTVLGTVRPGNGSYCLIGEDDITGSTGFAVLRPKNKNDSAFVYLGSCSKERIDRLAHVADGGASPAVRPKLVAQTPVIIATRDVLDFFKKCFATLCLCGR